MVEVPVESSPSAETQEQNAAFSRGRYFVTHADAEQDAGNQDTLL